MINVWMPPNPNPLLWNKLHSVVFDWDCSRNLINYTEDYASADWVVMLLVKDAAAVLDYIRSHGSTNSKRFICLNLFHADETMHSWFVEGDQSHQSVKFLRSQLQQQVLFLDQGLNIKSNSSAKDVIFYDFLWHRQIAYFCQYSQYDLKNRSHTYNATQDMYKLEPINKHSQARHYLAIMRTYDDDHNQKFNFRAKLRNFLDHSKGYVSDHSKGIFIECQQSLTVIGVTSQKTNYGAGLWWPAHNRYYQDSMVSIYCETCVHSTGYRLVTEKTWDPLIKGNFILPYGYQHLVEDIVSYGFLLPDWIDYSYDRLPDDLRFAAYLQSVQGILDLEQSQLYALYLRDRHILEHNRNIFFDYNRPSLIKQIQLQFSLLCDHA